VYLCMFRCGNIVLLRTRFLDMAKFSTVTPLSLLSSCKLSFPIVHRANEELDFTSRQGQTIFLFSKIPSLALETTKPLLNVYRGFFPGRKVVRMCS
jgi:hypothetical protein